MSRHRWPKNGRVRPDVTRWKDYCDRRNTWQKEEQERDFQKWKAKWFPGYTGQAEEYLRKSFRDAVGELHLWYRNANFPEPEP